MLSFWFGGNLSITDSLVIVPPVVRLLITGAEPYNHVCALRVCMYGLPTVCASCMCWKVCMPVLPCIPHCCGVWWWSADVVWSCCHCGVAVCIGA